MQTNRLNNITKQKPSYRSVDKSTAIYYHLYRLKLNAAIDRTETLCKVATRAFRLLVVKNLVTYAIYNDIHINIFTLLCT